MILSIIIPAHNEERTIGEILKRVLAQDLSGLGLEKEVIVVDDGSTDRTAELVEEFADVKLLRHNTNLGKGKAVLTGFERSGGNIILIQDADLEYSPDDYYSLLFPVVRQKVPVVYGTRFDAGSQRKNMKLLYFVANKVGTGLMNLLYNANLSDEATCYKVFTKDLFKDLNIRCDGFGFDPEVTAKVLKRGIKIHEVPIRYSARSRRHGKKFACLDGIDALWTILRLRFSDS